MLPEGWNRATVADVCSFQNGHGFGPEDWDDKGFPIIRIQNLNGGKKFDYFSGTPEAEWIVHSGQLLFAWAGTRGVSFGPTVWRGPTGVLNQHIFKVTANTDVQEGWLYWALRHVTDRVERNAHGFKDTLVHVKKSDIERQSVSVPSPEDQKRISATLDTWDAAIATTERLLANSREQCSVLAQKLMSGRTRQKGTLAWKKRTLSELMRESRVLGSGGHEARKLTVKLYAKGVIEKSSRGAGSESTQYYRRSAGQFIYSKLDFLNGAFGLVPAELDGYESTLDLPAFDLLPDVDARWLLYFVSREEFYRSQLGLANGGRKARRVNPKDLLQIAIPVPGIMEQQAIADALDLAWKIARDDEAQLRSLRIEKSVLMQQLLTGKRRVCLPAATEAVAC
jgi:type I restriction enzyme S subunit